MRTRLLVLLAVSATALVLLLVYILAFVLPPQQEQHSFSFENSMEDWVAKGVDLEYDGGTLEWSIMRSQERARDGTTSVKFYLNNLNDAGKVWIERSFEVQPNKRYQVTLSYAFASADFGGVNLWTIISGALTKHPETREDLTPAYQDETGNGLQSDSGYVWVEKRYDVTVESGPDGVLWTVVGVWGTWEGPRTYYVDSLTITLTER